MMSQVTCIVCGKDYPMNGAYWFLCNKCNFRVCAFCLNKHKGKYSSGGYKCSQCIVGQMRGPRPLN